MKAVLTGGEKYADEVSRSNRSRSCVGILHLSGLRQQNRAGMNQDLWRLRAADISDMNDIQKQLLASSWNLLNKYNLPDSARLVENSIKEF